MQRAPRESERAVLRVAEGTMGVLVRRARFRGLAADLPRKGSLGSGARAIHIAWHLALGSRGAITVNNRMPAIYPGCGATYASHRRKTCARA
eukprot:scaffold14602_cov118-Isochrysis_galbana.AAC.4